MVLTDGNLVGYAGELHPKTLAALGLPARTVALELDVEVLTRASEETTRYHEISTFPAALTDVALVVADTVTAGEVERSLRSGAGDFLEEVALFDVYAGEQVGDGRDVAGLPADLPRTGPDAHDRGGQRVPRRRGGLGRARRGRRSAH